MTLTDVYRWDLGGAVAVAAQVVAVETVEVARLLRPLRGANDSEKRPKGLAEERRERRTLRLKLKYPKRAGAPKDPGPGPSPASHVELRNSSAGKKVPPFAGKTEGFTATKG